VFRDSRGVVHTVCSTDPLADLPGDTARALSRALLRPYERDLDTSLERCEAVRELLERWQDAFFEGLPDLVDLTEEAAEAGLSLAEVESTYDPRAPRAERTRIDLVEQEEPADPQQADLAEQAALEALDLRGFGEPGELADELPGLDLTAAEDELVAGLPEELVSLLERELLLLPLRVRLEALVTAGDLVAGWADLFADHEKLLGHLVLAHGIRAEPIGHEDLAHLHAVLHAEQGPGHPSG
jgi:hypothetical protein